MKKILGKTILLFCVLSLSAEYAFGQVMNIYWDEPTKKKAFKYRKDVSKEAKKVMKDWYSTGVLHGDWIENKNGKSIDLQGNVLFPEVDYCRMTQIMLGVFMVEDRNQKKGVVEEPGRMMLPMRYDDIYCYPNQGLIKGVVGKYPQCTVDYYSTDGFLLFSAQNVKPDLDNDPFHFFYNFDQEVFEYSIGNEKHYKDAHGRDLTSKYLPADGARLQHSDKEKRELRARVAYANNAWIKLANEAMGKGDYRKAWELLDIYSKFDLLGSDNIGTSVEMLFITAGFRCAYATRQYDLIVNGYSANGDMAPWGFGHTYYIYKENGGKAVPSQWYSKFKNIYALSARSEMDMLVNVCCDIYNAAARHMPASMDSWNQQYTTVDQSVQQSASSFHYNSPGVLPEGLSYAPVTTDDYGTSQTYSNNNTSLSNTKSEPIRKTCPRCHGEKRVVWEHNVSGGYGLEVEMVTCSECGKRYDKKSTAHRHEVCSSCHGQGYLEFK